MVGCVVVVGVGVVANGLVILCNHGGMRMYMGVPTCRHDGGGEAKGLVAKFLNSNGMTTGQLGVHPRCQVCREFGTLTQAK